MRNVLLMLRVMTRYKENYILIMWVPLTYYGQ